MTVWIVRDATESDAIALSGIMQSATLELRNVYSPRMPTACRKPVAGVLVAVEGTTPIGSAEYVATADALYIQGVAVRPDRRRQGVCRSLLAKAEEVAQEAGLGRLTLGVIAETGNVHVFERLGFESTSCAIAADYVGRGGEDVTLVEMKREIPWPSDPDD